jgi:hypothetical protein
MILVRKVLSDFPTCPTPTVLPVAHNKITHTFSWADQSKNLHEANAHAQSQEPQSRKRVHGETLNILESSSKLCRLETTFTPSFSTNHGTLLRSKFTRKKDNV